DAALGTRSGDVGDLDAELTCEAANAGTRVGGNGAFARADRKRGRGGGWHRRRRRGGGRCGGEARCDRRGRLRARRGGRRTLGRRRGGAGWGFAASAPPSRSAIALPWLTLSPTFTRSSLTVPLEGAGTSIVALSLSSVMSDSSFFTTSPDRKS